MGTSAQKEGHPRKDGPVDLQVVYLPFTLGFLAGVWLSSERFWA